MVTTNKRSVVVTGGGGGLERDIVLGLAAKNYRVFGTAMTHEEISDLQRASDGAVTLTHCDITDKSAVTEWASGVAKQTTWRDSIFSSITPES